MPSPKYCLFYDNHTMPACPDVGKNFDAEKFTDRVKACGVDFLTFHARCNMGVAYYDTEIGIRHPTLDHDMFGDLAAACERKGILLSAYLNAGLSHEEALRHREWLRVDWEGKVYGNKLSPFVRQMCFNTPYRDHLKAMTLEVARKYPSVAGFFWDCMGSHTCVCPDCVREMKERGIDWTDIKAIKDFAMFSSERIAAEMAVELKKINPDYLLYFNGVSPVGQAESGTYLECECLPTGGWGYEFLPVKSRYLRNFGKTVLNMTGRFHKSWGDFGGIRTEPSLEYDLLYGLANGMRPNVGGHVHPRGDVNDAVFDLIETVYAKLRPYDEWHVDAVPQAEIAVVMNEKGYAGEGEGVPGSVEGATRMLCELKRQFDVVSESHDWRKYELIILPDGVLMTDEIKAKVKERLDAGKKIISSYESGMNTSRKGFAFEKEWGIKLVGMEDSDPAFFTLDAPYGEGLPNMPVSLYSTGIEMEANGARAFGKMIRSFRNFGWDGEHTNYYLPPCEETNIPILAVSGQVAHFSHPIFSVYNQKAPVPIRRLFENVLNELHPKPLVRTEGLPSFARAMVTTLPGRRMAHLLAYVPEKRGPSTEMIEEPIAVRGAMVSIRHDGTIPKKVYAAPDRRELEFTKRDGYVEVQVPEFEGYALIVAEQ